MSDENPPKKQKHVLLGAWLNEPDAQSSGTGAERQPTNAGGGGGNARGMGGGAWAGGRGGGGGEDDPWAKYEPPQGGSRANAMAHNSKALAANKNSSNAYGANRGHGSVRPSSTSGGGGAGHGGTSYWWGDAVDLSLDDDRAAPLPEGMDAILEGLCEEQQHVIKLVLRGKSVFFTGAAGTGKSFLLKKLHEALRQAGQGASTFMTGTTGKAAVGIGGCTVHSFAGIGLGNQSIEDMLMRVQRSRQAKKHWAECTVLVIDEISMMEADLFDKLNIVGQRVKGNPQPFGGIQLVLCGDFFQLPPIGIGRGTTRFCFEAKTWETSIDQSIVLKQVFRQKDPAFLSILHEMREGRVSPEAQQILAEKVEAGRVERAAAKRAREEASDDAVPNPGDGFGGGGEAVGEGGGGGGTGDGGNGSGGFAAAAAVAAPKAKPTTYTRLFSKNEDVDRLNMQELRKLQGNPEFYDASDSGDPAYLKQLQNHCAATARLELKVGAKVLLLKNLDSSSQLVNGATGVVTEFIEASGRFLPMVEFDTTEGYGKVAAVIREEEWSVSLGNKEMARRVQLPLRLAWALSVHKSQGMTITNVMVSTMGMFEYGQAYVALSRATTLEGLHLLDFKVGVVRAHEKVKAFYSRLEGRAIGGPSRAVTAVPRQGQAAPKSGEWITRSSRPTNASYTSSPLSQPSSGTRVKRPGAGAGGGLSPAARERMAENRRKALEKLAEKRRQKALDASFSPGGF